MPGGLVFAQHTHRQAYGTSGAVALPSMGTRKAASHESDHTCRGGDRSRRPYRNGTLLDGQRAVDEVNLLLRATLR
jgi:hypothetical protein